MCLGIKLPVKIIDLKNLPMCTVHEKVHLMCGHDMNAVPLHFCGELLEGEWLAAGLVKLRATNVKLSSYYERCQCKNEMSLLNRPILSM